MAVTSLEAATAAIDGSMPGTWKADVISAANISPKSIHWLWPSWLAAGKLTVLAGDAGTGKTTLCLGLVATLSCGGRWPDGEPSGVGNSIIWSAEDDPSDTLIPRLMAMGANLSRVYIIQGRSDDQGNQAPFDPSVDMNLLNETADKMGGVSLLMLDPMVSAVKGDMHRANDVRRGLQPVVDFASRHSAAVIGISHFTKGGKGSSPLDRVIGSQAFGALARMVLVAAKQEDSDMRVLARAKSNIAIDDGGVSYGIEEVTTDCGIQAVRVYWGDKVEGSAREILASVEYQDDEAGELDNAESYLRDLLATGPVKSKQVKADSNDAGFAWVTIRRAQKKLGVEAYRDGEGIASKSAWFWRLPLGSSFTNMLMKSPNTLTVKSEHLSKNVSTLAENGDLDGGAEPVKIRTGTL